MPYLYLIISVAGVASSSILGAFYNRANAQRKDAAPLYSFILFATVFLFWTVMFLFDRTYDVSVIPYSIAFALGFVACTLGTIYALKTGPVVLTSLIIQLSLIGVSIWGFFFWDSPFTILIFLGLILIALSLWLCLYTKEQTENKITPKWIFWVSLVFLGNAACSIIQKTQQMNYNGNYGNFLMMVATFFSMIFCLILYLRSDRSESKTILKASAHYPILSGAMNAVTNLCVMLLATSTLSPSLIYPVIAVGSLSLNTLFSAFIFKEKMSIRQWIGVAVGAVAVAILSI